MRVRVEPTGAKPCMEGVARKTLLRLGSFVFVAATALAVAAWVARASSAAPAPLPCGQWPTAAPLGTVPTPRVAPTPAGSQTRAPRLVAIGTWSTCFRPAVVTIEAGETIQWQQADSGDYRIALDNGTQFGPVHHVLEVRFNRPGTYGYHRDQVADIKGTIIVSGQPRPGPAFEIG